MLHSWRVAARDRTFWAMAGSVVAQAENSGSKRQGHCGVCAGDLSPPILACPACGAQHHQECWEYADGCAIYGCSQSLSLAQGSGEPAGPAVISPKPRPWWAAAAEAGSRIPGTSWHILGAVTTLGSPLCVAALVVAEVLCDPPPPTWLMYPFFATTVLGLWLWTVHESIPELLGSVGMETGPGRLRALTDAKALESRLAGDPKNPIILEALGFELLLKGQLADALGLYERALQIRPRSQAAAYYRGRILMMQGRTVAAKSALSQAVTLDPGTAVAGRSRWWLSRT